MDDARKLLPCSACEDAAKVVEAIQIDGDPYAPYMIRAAREIRSACRHNAALAEPQPAASAEDVREDEIPLECALVDGSIRVCIGTTILAFATENCPELWDSDRDCGRYRVTDHAAFAKEVVRELNHEAEDGSTPLTRLLNKCVVEAIEQGAEGVEEAALPAAPPAKHPSGGAK